MPNTSVNYLKSHPALAANHELAPPWLVFTGLDGLLVDPFNYQIKPATSNLEALKSHNIPVIFNSNKTFSELLEIRKMVGNEHPFIIENGGAICIPDGYFKTDYATEKMDGYSIYFLSSLYSMIIQKLHRIRASQNYNFEGFYDWNREEIAKRSGINQHLALLNQQRLCSEPIMWYDTAAQFESFKAELEEYKLTITPANNYFLISGQSSKASAMEILKSKYQKEHQTNIQVFSLSNSPQDARMLTRADYSSLIRKDGEESRTGYSKNTYFTKEKNIEGWNESIEHFMKNIYHAAK